MFNSIWVSPQDLWLWNLDNHPIFKITILGSKEIVKFSKKIVSFWQVMNEGGGPFDDFFHFVAGWDRDILLLLLLDHIFSSSPPNSIDIFVYLDKLGLLSRIMSAISTLSSDLICCFGYYHTWVQLENFSSTWNLTILQIGRQSSMIFALITDYLSTNC